MFLYTQNYTRFPTLMDISSPYNLTEAASTCLFCKLSHLAFLFSALLSGRALPFWFRCRGVNRFSLRWDKRVGKPGHHSEHLNLYIYA